MVRSSINKHRATAAGAPAGSLVSRRRNCPQQRINHAQHRVFHHRHQGKFNLEVRTWKKTGARQKLGRVEARWQSPSLYVPLILHGGSMFQPLWYMICSVNNYISKITL